MVLTFFGPGICPKQFQAPKIGEFRQKDLFFYFLQLVIATRDFKTS